MLKFQTYKFMDLSNLTQKDSRKKYLGCYVLQCFPLVVYLHMPNSNKFTSLEVISH